MRARRADIKSQRGSALPSVLVMSSVLALSASAFVQSSRYEAQAMRHGALAIETQHAADGGLQRAIADLETATPLIPRDGSVYAFDFAGYRLAISITDERGKIDLNKSAATIIANLIDRVAAENDLTVDADQAAAEIVDLRADREDTQKLVAIDEILRAPSVSEELFQLLAPHITVVSFTNRINATAASREVLLSLPGVSESDVARIIAARQRGEAIILQQAAPWLSNERGPFFGVKVGAIRSGNMSTERQAVVWMAEGEEPAIVELRSN